MCPCVCVCVGYGSRGMAAAASGLLGKETPRLGGGAWGGCRHSLTPNSLLQVPVMPVVWSLGLPLKQSQGGAGSWLVAHPYRAHCSTTHRGVLQLFVLPCCPPTRCWPLFLNPLSSILGCPLLCQRSRGGEAPHSPPVLLLWLQVLPCPPWGRGGGQIQQRVVVRDSSA